MFSLFILIAALAYLMIVVAISYKLGKTKTDNAKLAATIGFIVAFLPPLALIYLAVLLFKEETSIV